MGLATLRAQIDGMLAALGVRARIVAVGGRLYGDLTDQARHPAARSSPGGVVGPPGRNQGGGGRVGGPDRRPAVRSIPAGVTLPMPRSLSSSAVLLLLLAGCAEVTRPAQAADPLSGPAAGVPSAPTGIPPAPGEAPPAPGKTPSEPGETPPTPSGSAPAWVEPPAYTYVLTVGCTRGFSGARYRVTVADHAVVAAVPLEPQAAAHPDFPVPTLAGIAAWAAEARARGDRIRYDRDPADGRPVAAGFDPGAMAVDAGECFAVSGYRAG